MSNEAEDQDVESTMVEDDERRYYENEENLYHKGIFEALVEFGIYRVRYLGPHGPKRYEPTEAGKSPHLFVGYLDRPMWLH